MTLDPKLQRDLSMKKFPITQGMEKLLGSFNLGACCFE